MPRMIPSVISQDTKSSAEISFFSALQHLEGCDDWIVIHSLGLAEHAIQSQGEVDFVILIPQKGIFALEVKGGIEITCNNGEWNSVDRYGNIHKIKNPGVEANEGMHSLLDFLKRYNRDISRSIVGFGVVFPDCTVHGKLVSPDISDKQICDADDMMDLKHYFYTLSKFWVERLGRVNLSLCVPTKEICDKIADLIRPNINLSISAKTEIHSLENSIITLTERQQDIFDGLKENDRVLVSGSAGTGKTLLAVNYAINSIKPDARIGMFCYNVKLGKFLKKNVGDNDNIICGSFTEYMEEVVSKTHLDEVTKAKEINRNHFYAKVLPELFVEDFINNEEELIDCLIIDEAQDLLSDTYLEVINLILKGGLKDGKWYFFADAEKQNIFHPSITYESMRDKLEVYANYTKLHLKENCRNSVSIIKKLNELFGGPSEVSYKYREENYGPDVLMVSYKNNNEQTEKLEECIQKLLDEGIKPSEITVLSPKTFENSVASCIKKIKIAQANFLKQKEVSFSTISSFKGLENTVVIISDLDKIKTDYDKHLLYVGMTRARSELIILTDLKTSNYIETHKGGL